MDEPVSVLRRAFDVCFAAVALALASPVMLAIAVSIRATSPAPVVYTQIRLGRDRVPFLIHKFRTLEVGSDEDDTIAPEGDPRVTRIGRGLRHYRLDELPQLYDVLRGCMAVVGPRPETPANLSAVDDDLLDRWLSVRPGLTGPTQLAFIAEDELLRHVANPTRTYREVLVPAKVRHGVEWLGTQTVTGDLTVLSKTLVVLSSQRARRRSRRHVEALLRGAST